MNGRGLGSGFGVEFIDTCFDPDIGVELVDIEIGFGLKEKDVEA